MKRDYWLFPESNLLVEKYYGVVNREDFDRFDGSLIRQVGGENKKVYALADISQASFFNIKYDDIPHLHQALVRRIGDNNAKIAFINGENAKDDYLKVSQFTKFESEQLSIESFVDFISGMKWLELSEPVRKVVLKKINY